MLRGMGWKDGITVDKDGKMIKPVDAVLRPKGMGLGADRSLARQAADKDDSQESKDKEQLDMKKGAYCVVTTGKHRDLYGVVCIKSVII